MLCFLKSPRQRSSHWKCSVKRCSQEFLNKFFFLIKKRLWQGFPCEFCEISKNTFLTEHSGLMLLKIIIISESVCSPSSPQAAFHRCFMKKLISSFSQYSEENASASVCFFQSCRLYDCRRHVTFLKKIVAQVFSYSISFKQQSNQQLF